MKIDEQSKKKLMSKVWRMHNLYKITTKLPGHEGKEVRFQPNWAQKEIYKKIEEGWKRIIILKPRQLGSTTGIMLYLLDTAQYSPNQRCRTIAHRKDTVTELFEDKVLYAFKRIPEPLRMGVKHITRAELNFQDIGSKYSVDVEARGMTPSMLHFSEVAYVEDEVKLEDTLQSLSTTALGIAESTANGKGNWFERTFTKNWERLQAGEKPQWYPMFFAWFNDPSSVLPWKEGTRFMFPSEIAEMRAKYRNQDGSTLTDHQLLWWDKKKFELEDRMSELYPSTPEEAFIFSTGRVYPNFSRSIHVTSAMQFEDYEIAMDYGQQNPMVFLMVHRDSDDNFVVFREFYRKECPIADAAAWLHTNAKEKMDSNGYVHIRYPDPSVFGKTQVRTTMTPGTSLADSHGNIERSSIAEEFRKHKIILHRGAQNAVLPGISRVKEYMKFDPGHTHPFKRDEYGDIMKGSPRLFITEECTSLIWEFSNYLWPKDGTGNLNRQAAEAPRKQHDHACLTDSVKCEVKNKGMISIKQVEVGDYVRSASGWTKVLASGCTGEGAIRRIELEGSYSIEGTDNHPVFVIGKGLVQMKYIKYNDHVCISQDLKKQSVGKSYGSMGSPTTDTPKPQTQNQVEQEETISLTQEQKKDTTWNFGRKTMVRYLKDLISTMLMGIHSITHWAIFYACRKVTMQELQSWNKLVFRSNVAYAIKSLELKTLEKTGGQYDSVQLTVEQKHITTKRDTMKKGSALCVERKHSKQEAIQLNVAPSLVLSNSVTGQEKKVYNLETEDGTYYANGILTSNCDSLRYAIMTWAQPLAELQQQVGAPGTLLHLIDLHEKEPVDDF